MALYVVGSFLVYLKQRTESGQSYTLGALTFLMFLARYAIFNLQESPKYLLAKGRDQDAIEVSSTRLEQR
jgi:hypothetical protein